MLSTDLVNIAPLGSTPANWMSAACAPGAAASRASAAVAAVRCAIRRHVVVQRGHLLVIWSSLSEGRPRSAGEAERGFRCIPATGEGRETSYALRAFTCLLTAAAVAIATVGARLGDRHRQAVGLQVAAAGRQVHADVARGVGEGAVGQRGGVGRIVDEPLGG